MNRLLACPACARHVRDTESRCPFCAAEVTDFIARAAPPARVPHERLGRAALFAFATASAGLAGCHRSTDDAIAPGPLASNAAEPAGATQPGASPAAADTTAAQDSTGAPPSATAAPGANPLPSSPDRPVPAAPRITGLEALSPGAKLGSPSSAYGAPPAPESTVRGNVAIGGVMESGGAVGNSARVIAGMRAGMRACYQHALQANPTLEGRVQLRLQVGKTGEVLQVKTTVTKDPGAEVVSCVEARVRKAKFEPPANEEPATIGFPITFTKESR